MMFRLFHIEKCLLLKKTKKKTKTLNDNNIFSFINAGQKVQAKLGQFQGCGTAHSDGLMQYRL